MGKKIVFFDIDQTLYHPLAGVPESTRNAIAMLQKNGHLAFINTGRARVHITDKEQGGIVFDGIVASCGTYIEHSGKIVLDRHWEQNEVLRVIRYLRAKGMKLILEGTKALYYYPQEVDETNARWIESIKQTLGEKLIPLYGEEEDIMINKMTLQAPAGVKLESVRNRLEENYDFIRHHEDVAEIVPKGFSKATGIEYLINKMGIHVKDVYAFGDSGNDLDMIRYAGQGIAMGNATEEAKDCAQYITATILEDGIWHALKHYGLI